MKNKYVFILTIAIVCSLLLSLASEGLKDLRNKNIEIDKKYNILTAIGVDVDNFTVLDVDKSNNRIRVNFHGWGKKWREWIIIPSDRIAPHKFYGGFSKKTGKDQKRITNYENHLNYEPIISKLTTSLRKPNLSYSDIVKK